MATVKGKGKPIYYKCSHFFYWPGKNSVLMNSYPGALPYFMSLFASVVLAAGRGPCPFSLYSVYYRMQTRVKATAGLAGDFLFLLELFGPEVLSAFCII